jgi:hypothetical protein
MDFSVRPVLAVPGLLEGSPKNKIRATATCWTCFIREDLTMAVLKVHPKTKEHLVMPAFSFATDSANPVATGLANMIIDAWNNVSFTFTPPGGVATTVNLRDALLQRDTDLLPTTLAVQTATARANGAGLGLTRAVVITEAEHNNDYVMQSDDEIVLVLPDERRAIIPTPFPAPPYPTPLLNTAKFLMACTPNGI